MEEIKSALSKLEKYIEIENYKGYDPYDYLNSPLFTLPIFSHKLVRFPAQQFGKRFPINLRSLIGIKKGTNPVTLGLCIQAYSNLYKLERDDLYLKKIDHLISYLTKFIPEGYPGACWGYDFEWETRYVKLPSFTPTVVATGIITNALFICYEITGNEEAKNLIINSSEFVLNSLNRIEQNGILCFSYSPFDTEKVLNANMMAMRILIQTYALTSNEKILCLLEKAIKYVINNQNSNGSWGYSEKINGRIDSYHTGYVLDCLYDYIKFSNDKRYKPNLNLGINYFIENLIEHKSVPKFYSNKKLPLDCTSAAQIILTLTRFGFVEIAQNVAQYMIKKMQHRNGYFYFRKFKTYTIKTSYMRWSNAWMFAALSYLLSEEINNKIKRKS